MAISPTNELDRDFAPKNLCAKFRYTHTHTNEYLFRESCSENCSLIQKMWMADKENHEEG